MAWKELEKILATHCPNVFDDGLKALIEGCSKLKYVNCFWTSVTEGFSAQLFRFSSIFPKLSFYKFSKIIISIFPKLLLIFTNLASEISKLQIENLRLLNISINFAVPSKTTILSFKKSFFSFDIHEIFFSNFLRILKGRLRNITF